MTEKIINKLIVKKILEIIIVILLMIFSYIIITTNNLSESAKIANEFAKTDLNAQVMYGRTHENSNNIAYYENIIDEGTLSIRNPNIHDKKVDVILVIEGPMEKIQNLDFYFDDKKIDLISAKLEDGRYKQVVGNYTLLPYQNIEKILNIKGNPYDKLDIQYTFECVESFIK